MKRTPVRLATHARTIRSLARSRSAAHAQICPTTKPQPEAKPPTSEPQLIVAPPQERIGFVEPPLGCARLR
jgi:hypothetical protein